MIGEQDAGNGKHLATRTTFRAKNWWVTMFIVAPFMPPFGINRPEKFSSGTLVCILPGRGVLLKPVRCTENMFIPYRPGRAGLRAKKLTRNKPTSCIAIPRILQKKFPQNLQERSRLAGAILFSRKLGYRTTVRASFGFYGFKKGHTKL